MRERLLAPCVGLPGMACDRSDSKADGGTTGTDGSNTEDRIDDADEMDDASASGFVPGPPRGVRSKMRAGPTGAARPLPRPRLTCIRACS